MQLKHFLLLAPLCLLAACNSQESSISSAPRTAASAEQVLGAADSVSFAADIADIRSGSRKMIRNAGLRCRVADVFTATTALERIVKNAGGVVEESNMQNENNRTEQVYYKPDSVKQVQSYTTTAQLTLRVPAAALDSVLDAIPTLSVFVEQRSLGQSDVTLQYLSNALKNKLVTANSKAQELSKKTTDAIDADSYDNDKKERRIDRSIENLSLLDNANYATLKVSFTQPQRMNTIVIVNPGYFSEPPYGTQFLLALNRGWEILRSVLLLCVTVWPLCLVAALVMLLWWKFRKPVMLRS